MQELLSFPPFSQVVFIYYYFWFIVYFYCWHYNRCPHFPPSHCPLTPALDLPSLRPSPHCSVSMGHVCIFFANSFTLFHSVSPPSLLTAASLFHVSGPLSILFIRVFCSLDSTYKWDHMVFVFLWLACFTQHNPGPFILSQKVFNSWFMSPG